MSERDPLDDFTGLRDRLEHVDWLERHYGTRRRGRRLRYLVHVYGVPVMSGITVAAFIGSGSALP